MIIKESKSDLIMRLERECKLRLQETSPGSRSYLERSGKSYKKIQSLINKFNKDYSTSVICWNDRMKDATYIET